MSFRAKRSDKEWSALLRITHPEVIARTTWKWVDHLGPIFGSKLLWVLSGSASLEGTIPRTVMSAELRNALDRVVSFISHSYLMFLILDRLLVSLETPVGPRSWKMRLLLTGHIYPNPPKKTFSLSFRLHSLNL